MVVFNILSTMHVYEQETQRKENEKNRPRTTINMITNHNNNTHTILLFIYTFKHAYYNIFISIDILKFLFDRPALRMNM